MSRVERRASSVSVERPSSELDVVRPTGFRPAIDAARRVTLDARHSTLDRVLTLFLLCLGCPSKDDPGAASAANALASIAATCAAAQGQVHVKRTRQAFWVQIGVGAVFHAGDWLRTGSKSSARIQFVSGGGLELDEEAMVIIDLSPPKPGMPSEALVSLESGVVHGVAPPAAPDQPQAGVLIRAADGSQMRLVPKAGTEVHYRLTKGSAGTEVAIIEGQATLASAGVERELSSGQTADFSSGRLSEPVELPDFPQSLEPGIDARLRFANGMAIRLAWQEVPDAKGYRLQVARDLSFLSIALTAEPASPEHSWPPAEPGLYVWRVATRDRAGRVGEFGFARRIFCEREEPRDLLLAPRDREVVAFSGAPPSVVFSWRPAASGAIYRLVLAKGEDLLREQVATETSTEAKVTLQGLSAGEYFWGAYLDGPDQEPIFLKPRNLTLKRVAKATLKTPKAINTWGP